MYLIFYINNQPNVTIISTTVTHTKLTHCITVNLFIVHILQAETVLRNTGPCMTYTYDPLLSQYILWLMVVLT